LTPLLTHPEYFFFYGNHFSKYLPVVEPKYHQGIFFQKSVTYYIIFSVYFIKVLATVSFYYQLNCWSVKVDNVRTDWFLTVKLDIEYLFSAQMKP